MKQGMVQPVPMNDNEVNEVKNLRKKVDHLRDQIYVIDEQLSDAKSEILEEYSD